MFSGFCPGTAKGTPSLSAICIHPAFSAKVGDSCKQPCNTTTNGAGFFKLLGIYLNIIRLPGFDPKLVTWTGLAASACEVTPVNVSAIWAETAITTLYIVFAVRNFELFLFISTSNVGLDLHSRATFFQRGSTIHVAVVIRISHLRYRDKLLGTTFLELPFLGSKLWPA